MKAGIYFTGTGPILLLTTYGELNDARLLEKLEQKGIKKFIAYEVPEIWSGKSTASISALSWVI